MEPNGGKTGVPMEQRETTCIHERLALRAMISIPWMLNMMNRSKIQMAELTLGMQIKYKLLMLKNGHFIKQ